MPGSTLDPSNLPARPTRKTPKGHDVRALGPSDSSDTGADMADQDALDDTSDRDVGPEEAGLGSGLDEIEDAWLEKDRGEH